MNAKGATQATQGEVPERQLAQFLKENATEPPELQQSLLPAVQARIREQTRGRYFGEKRRSYRDPTLLLLGSAALLLVLAAAFLGLFESLLR